MRVHELATPFSIASITAPLIASCIPKSSQFMIKTRASGANPSNSLDRRSTPGVCHTAQPVPHDKRLRERRANCALVPLKACDLTSPEVISAWTVVRFAPRYMAPFWRPSCSCSSNERMGWARLRRTDELPGAGRGTRPNIAIQVDLALSVDRPAGHAAWARQREIGSQRRAR